MTLALLGMIIALVAAVTGLAGLRIRDRARRSRTLRTSPKRIVFPFTGNHLSGRALDASLRLARADDATLVPIYLVEVALRLPLDTPLPRQCAEALPLLEAIEQRASALGVPVDSRIERGRNVRHALRELIAHERYDRIVIAASPRGGFDTGNVAWLLDNAPGEILVLRPGGDAATQAPGRAWPDASAAVLEAAQGASSSHRARVLPPEV